MTATIGHNQEQLDMLESRARNMHRALNNGDYRHVSEGNRYAIRSELIRTVNYLYRFNINLTDLLK